jgi:hypothetical protein
MLDEMILLFGFSFGTAIILMILGLLTYKSAVSFLFFAISAFIWILMGINFSMTGITVTAQSLLFFAIAMIPIVLSFYRAFEMWKISKVDPWEEDNR